MTSLKLVKGKELAEGVVADMRLPEGLTRFTIGRDPANHWPIPDRTLAISGRHCEIAVTAYGTVLRDLSTNGTFLNGDRSRLAGEHVLRHGDRFEIGPYVILVNDPRTPDQAVLLPLPAAKQAIAREATPGPSPGVESTTPLRGGDPAAMFAVGGKPKREGLTEILRRLPPAEDSGQAVTKISAAPRRSAQSASGSPPVARVAAAAPAAVVPPGADRTELLRPLAIALGLAPDALAGRDPGETVAQVGALARAAVIAMRQLLDRQPETRRPPERNGAAHVAVREADPLRLAATPEAALRALLAPGADVEALLRRAAAELSALLAAAENQPGKR